MKEIYSYCRKDLGEKPPLENKHISHGMCPECRNHFIRQIQRLPIKKHINNFEFPVAIVDTDGRFIATNEKASQLIGKEPENMIGFLGGEVLECCYTRLPKGCGKTDHCATCTIHRTLMSVMRTGLIQQDETDMEPEIHERLFE